MNSGKRVCKLAALICSAAANNNLGVFAVCLSFGVDDRCHAAYLARDAFYKTPSRFRWADRFLEAEAMIQNGDCQ